MRFRFTIGRKIGFGFAVLLLTTLVVFVLTYDTLSKGRAISDKINTVYNPSVSSLEVLKSTVLRSRTLINMWAFVQSREDTKEKLSLVQVVNEEIPNAKYSIDSLSVHWTEAERRQKEKIYKELDALLAMYSEVQSTLRDMQSYDDPFARFTMNEYAEDDGLIYQQAKLVIDDLNELIREHRANTTADSAEMIRRFDNLEGYLRYMSITLFCFGIIIAFFTVKSITKPVSQLKEVLLELGKGKFPQRAVVNTGDEVGEMSLALNQLVNALKRTTEFANQVGKGNFEVAFNPLSSEDVLGNALVVMRDGLQRNEQELKRNEMELELKVEERTKEVVKQKNKVEKQNQQRKELLDNITASIRYAKRLQENILPSDAQVRALLPHSFIYYKPKDIVSGDFYYVKEISGKIVYAAVDCTGHGVPGAFMSLVGHNALNHAIAQNPDLNPSRILTDLSIFAADAMNRTVHDASSRDGMDMALCVYTPAENLLEYAGAFNPLYIVRNNELEIYRSDKITLGAPEQTNLEFTRNRIKLEENDMIYIFSDGYVDQFGGAKGRKFLYRPFRSLLLEIAEMEPSTQKEILTNRMEAWRMGSGKKQEQIDDMLIIGVRHKKP